MPAIKSTDDFANILKEIENAPNLNTAIKTLLDETENTEPDFTYYIFGRKVFKVIAHFFENETHPVKQSLYLCEQAKPLLNFLEDVLYFHEKHQAYLKLATELKKIQEITITFALHVENTPVNIHHAINLVAELCFDGEQQFIDGFNGLNYENIIEWMLSKLSFMHSEFQESWLMHSSTKNLLQRLFHQFYEFSQISAEEINETQYNEFVAGLLAYRRLIARKPATRNPKPITGAKGTLFVLSSPVTHTQASIEPCPILSKITHDFYDWDDTIHHGDDALVQLMDVRHSILGIKAYIITARTKEMDCATEAITYKKTNGTYITVEPRGGIYTTPSYQKMAPFFTDEIIFCDFYDKITHEGGVYFEHTLRSKDSKVSDFKQYCDKNDIPTHLACIYDDKKEVWREDKVHESPNFFHVDNRSRDKRIHKHLLHNTLQVVFFGEHLPLFTRQKAAQKLMATQYFNASATSELRMQLMEFVNEMCADEKIQMQNGPC